MNHTSSHAENEVHHSTRCGCQHHNCHRSSAYVSTLRVFTPER